MRIWTNSYSPELGGTAFKVDGYEIMFPGDTSAPAYLVYNCRCTLIAAVDGADTSGALRRAKDPTSGKSVVIPDMTFAQWKTWKESENTYEWDVFERKGKNLSSDTKQWQEYRSVLGNKVPNTVEKFQDLKYNEPDEWEYIKGYRRYKGRIPEATVEDYALYNAVKATGVIGTVRVPPEVIEADEIEFKDEHGMNHGCTLDDARHYVKTAKCSIRRKRWDGISINFYSLDGAAYLDADTLKIKTAFAEKDFDPTTKSIAEVFK